MAADWEYLTRHLKKSGGQVRQSWAELEGVVGSLPASALNHRAWWSGDRTHVRAWKAAGYRLDACHPGEYVIFVPTGTCADEGQSTGRPAMPAHAQPPTSPGLPDIILISCVKTKLEVPAAAKDLYVSALFRKERGYAEATGRPWFILSAEHGLVAPEEWLAPYERYLPDTSRSYRQAWGAWVVERLALLHGELSGKRIEVHASGEYISALAEPLSRMSVTLIEPLRGLAQGARLAWYDRIAGDEADAVDRLSPAIHDEVASELVDQFVDKLRKDSVSLTPDEFLSLDRRSLQVPGLYSWWVDESGAADLSKGLGHRIEPGLIYAGLAGATRWPSAKRSSNTLWSRIAGMHLGKKHEFSTFRRTLGSVLCSAQGSPDIDEDRLTAWMKVHLRVVAEPYPDADALGRLEETVLDVLDPPLNLKGMQKTAVRRQLTELRKRHTPRAK